MAVVLGFLCLLPFRQDQARRTGNVDDLTAAQLHRKFLGEHLGAWTAGLTAAARTHAETAFYRELADLTERFARMEADAVRSRPAA